VRQEIAQEVGKAAPPVAVTTLAFMQGLTINEVVALATLAYIALQAAYLLWKWWREWRGKRR
jgi:hypothetical protein